MAPFEGIVNECQEAHKKVASSSTPNIILEPTPLVGHGTLRSLAVRGPFMSTTYIA